jgi:hypothetical protein
MIQVIFEREKYVTRINTLPPSKTCKSNILKFDQRINICIPKYIHYKKKYSIIYLMILITVTISIFLYIFDLS